MPREEISYLIGRIYRRLNFNKPAILRNLVTARNILTFHKETP